MCIRDRFILLLLENLKKLSYFFLLKGQNKISRRGSRMSLPGFKHENGGLDGSLLSLPTPISQKKNKNNRSGSGKGKHQS